MRIIVSNNEIIYNPLEQMQPVNKGLCTDP